MGPPPDAVVVGTPDAVTLALRDALQASGARRLMVEVFSRPGWVAFYVIGMIIIGFHLWHGVSSAFQSLGVDPPGWAQPIRAAGWTLAVIIAGGFLVIPVGIFFGWV